MIKTTGRTISFFILLRSRLQSTHRISFPRPIRSGRTGLLGCKPYTSPASESPHTARSKLLQRPWITASAIAVVSSILVLISRRDFEDGNTLQVDRYKSYPIKSIKNLSADTALFEIEIPPLPADDDSSEKAFHIESIYIKHPALQIERPYTPLSAVPRQNQFSEIDGLDQERSASRVELLVKRYPDGDLSTFLHRERLPGNDVEVRGPVPTWRHEGSQLDELIFIAAGTGITPAIQLLRRLYKKHPSRPDLKLPKFNLIYLTNSIESAHALVEIRQFCSRYPHLINARLIVEKAPSPEQSSLAVDKVGRLELGDLQRWLGDNRDSDRQRLILICGPDGLINAVAGPKGRDMVSQGALGGMLKTLGYSSDQVYKL